MRPDSRSSETELIATLEHPIIQRLSQRLASLTPLVEPVGAGVKQAAVAALVRIVGNPGRAELLFIKRADMERDPWSGHIAFPGGRFEVGDASLADTAMRETREELSLDVARYGRLLGRLDDLAPRSRTLPSIVVRPFVGVVAPNLAILKNHEVASAFWVPVQQLGAAESRGEHVMTVDNAEARFPAYRIDSHVVWGLTERIVAQLLPLFGSE